MRIVLECYKLASSCKSNLHTVNWKANQNERYDSPVEELVIAVEEVVSGTVEAVLRCGVVVCGCDCVCVTEGV